VKSFLERFESFLHGKGLRLTNQRAEILRAIYRTHRHVTAEQLYEMIRDDAKTKELRISRATVYRTLGLLAEGGFVDALDLGRDQGVRYEHSLGHEHHDHMVCTDCGKIIEFNDPELERVQDEVVARHGFVATSHQLNVYGTCSSCSRRERKKGAPAPDSAEA